ncbi:MAG: homocysteine S-methyltransferase family protein, partial [SAR324 cluster bacterium]|nr:homocysteine S-methyltransferase family protein [SAR324 cluster bacterium]
MLEKLKDKGYLILDGAMGSNLFLLGLISGDSPEAWNLEHPDRVKKVHQAFVQAGS